MAETLILMAEPKQEQRVPIAGALVAAGLADRVIPSENGRRLVTDFTRALQRGDIVKAVVLNVNLSVVGGKTCSIALRCIEQAFEHPPAQILFLSSKPMDQNQKRVMGYVKYSRFLTLSEPPDSGPVIDNLREMLA